MQPVSIHWFRRDLRTDDNPALVASLASPYPTLCVFIFDKEIIENLPANDARITFIHDQLTRVHEELKSRGSSLLVLHGKPEEQWKRLLDEYEVKVVHTNQDYEPYAVNRDRAIAELLFERSIPFNTHQDHVFFRPGEVIKGDGTPYTVYTPFRKQWEKQWTAQRAVCFEWPEKVDFYPIDLALPKLEELGFVRSDIETPPFKLGDVSNYNEKRNFPRLDSTSKLGPHLRFGTIGLRRLWSKIHHSDDTFKHQLIWREFFIHIMVAFPHVLERSFRSKYDRIEWRNNEEEFEHWKTGNTGYPLVDAGMRELNTTGYMHNRVRMVTASFLVKHLLIDWRWGEAYFAEKLLDFELAANNGNWQWCAGTGCDAAPYFRVFNPTEQVKKFDKQMEYIQKWVPEVNELTYPSPMVEHKMARERALAAYKKAVSQ